MHNFNKGSEVGISTKALYDAVGSDLTYGSICYTSEGEDPQTQYYDLFNEDGILACMDGETVTVIEIHPDRVVFEDEYGDTKERFALTHEEADIATFNYPRH